MKRRLAAIVKTKHAIVIATVKWRYAIVIVQSQVVRYL